MTKATKKSAATKKTAQPKASNRPNGRKSINTGEGIKTRRERLVSKEDAIIKAAYKMFIDQGFAKTTMSEIARNAGVAEGTLYIYFNNKDALARAVLADFYDRLTQAAKKGVEKYGATKERLIFLARHHLRNIIKERRLLELISVMDRDPEVYKDTDLYKMNRAYVSVFDDVVREGVWRKEIKENAELWILRDLFFGGLEYGMRTILLKRRGAEQKINQLSQSLVAMILSDAVRGDKVDDLAALKSLENTADRFEKTAARLERITGRM